MACVRCGCCVCHTEDAISLNKMWHRTCFTCRNCNEKLDKCTAKIYQGDVYCQKCQRCICGEHQNVCCPAPKPCRVVSSPSFICVSRKNCSGRASFCRSKFNTCTKLCFSREKLNCPNASRSCSYISEVKKAHCFGFPMPREVANYYNRKNMKRTCEPCGRKKRTCIKVRSLSPKCCVPRCRSPTRRTCCTCGTGCQGCPESPEYCTCDRKPKPCKPQCRTPCCPNPIPILPHECNCSGCCPSPPSCSPPKQCCPPKRCCPKQPCVYPNPRCPVEPYSCPKPCCPKPCCPDPTFRRNPCDRSPGVLPKCCPNNRPECRRQCRCTCVPPPKPPCGACCDCTMCQVRLACQSICNRCGQKVYAAEKISVSCGAYHSCCFTCYCCCKTLDVKNVFEHCNEIYCRNCYNYYFGIQCYGFGSC